MQRWLRSLGLVGLLIGVRAPLALAHEGHAHKVMGTVATIHENHLEVKDKNGKITMHALDTKTKIRRGKAVATWRISRPATASWSATSRAKTKRARPSSR